MTNPDPNVINEFKGQFLVSPAELQAKLFNIKAFITDWDGVFNNGHKDGNGSSPFSEVDSMGTNMLRFNHYLRTGHAPVFCVITGENNTSAYSLAKREHFNAVYYKVLNKTEALNHICKTHSLQPQEVAFFFDDVLDLSVAEQCGVRLMVGRNASPLFMNYVKQHRLADYVTYSDGNNMAVREMVELIMGLAGRYDDALTERMHYTDTYKHFLTLRNRPETDFFTSIDSQITIQVPQ
jgi:3-deoxy-D-manno-octulosonate 8-phosphate phosphatase (KDO 8-P phosphatase)